MQKAQQTSMATSKALMAGSLCFASSYSYQ